MSGSDPVVARVKRRAFAIAGISIAGALLFGPRRAASLTICAAVVVFSLLALEKVLERLDPGVKPGFRTVVPLLLVTAASFVLLGVVLWRWKGFDPVAGALGLSVVVLAIIPELWARR